MVTIDAPINKKDDLYQCKFFFISLVHKKKNLIFLDIMKLVSKYRIEMIDIIQGQQSIIYRVR